MDCCEPRSTRREVRPTIGNGAEADAAERVIAAARGTRTMTSKIRGGHHRGGSGELGNGDAVEARGVGPIAPSDETGRRHEEDDDEKEEGHVAEGRVTIALDRRENQGAGRLAWRGTFPDPLPGQGGRP